MHQVRLEYVLELCQIFILIYKFLFLSVQIHHTPRKEEMNVT